MINDKKKYLITGAQGFIGNYLCRQLLNSHHYVKAVIKKPVEERALSAVAWNEALVCDLRDLTHIEQKRIFGTYIQDVHTIFHLAGMAHTQDVSEEDYHSLNIEATRNILAIAEKAGTRAFIYFSSIKSIQPNDVYGRSKQAAENLVLDWGLKNNRWVCILRPALVYGLGMKGNLLQMFRGVKQGWFPPIPETHNARSLVSVEDLVNAALLVDQNMQKSNAKRYIVAENKIYSSREIYDLMRKVLNLTPTRLYLPYWFLKMVAISGDMLQRCVKRRMPINSDMLDKLFGSSVYFATEIKEDLGWKPTGDLLTVLQQIARSPCFSKSLPFK